jgi:hypothetical protein
LAQLRCVHATRLGTAAGRRALRDEVRLLFAEAGQRRLTSLFPEPRESEEVQCAK